MYLFTTYLALLLLPIHPNLYLHFHLSQDLHQNPLILNTTKINQVITLETIILTQATNITRGNYLTIIKHLLY